LYQEFGADRMVDTPISELGFTGAALGASATGLRVIADLMFADFLFEAAGQIALQAAKLRYMSNGQMNAPMVIRVGCGTVRSTGPHHSGTYHPVWAHIPGLIVCMPATPADAKGLMKTALRAGDPVLMLEPKALFASKGPVPEGEHFVPFGLARIARAGKNLTIAATGQMVHRALEAAETLAADGIDVEVIDLRTIQPLDVETVAESISKTHHLLVVDEGWPMMGLGAELGQAMSEIAFDQLDAPVARLHTAPTTHPFGPALERAMLVNAETIVARAREVLDGRATAPWRWRGRPDGVQAPVQAASAPAPKQPAAAPAPRANGPAGEPIAMPFGDLTVDSGKLVRWTVADGARVKRGEIVAEIETDKAVVEIEAPSDGTVIQTVKEAGTVVKMGGAIGVVGAA
jgi:2-oxoisovalerate dehydrogenase E1 component